MSGGKHSVIVLKDVKAEELEALLTYMYEGEVNVLQEKLSGLIKAAEYLKVKGLSDSDENPEVFSKSFSKRSGKNSFSKEDSASPPAKRHRQASENSHAESVNDGNPKSSEGQEHNPVEIQESVADAREPFTQQNQAFDIDAVKEEADMEIQNEPFGFRDESSHFLNEQDENLPQITDISLPSVSSQPQIDKDASATIFSEEGNTSNNMWDMRDLPNATVSNATRIGSSCYITEVDPSKGARARTDGEHLTITPDDLVPLISEEEEESANGTFACPFCPFKTFQKNVHDTHLRRHSSDKTFFCQFCSYSCLTKSNLKCHIRKHTGEKPFACPHCNYRSAQSSNIKIHVKRMHKNSPPVTQEQRKDAGYM
ncbi:Longitudinals lacking protein [Armadillidium nasatum]|uniref:Longitudinals lacking protein n=1 Tax=Armadillidium nasatum TaxID=96803 RepID=A0A5N5THZ2_9CRUS|nr:Longitudinals lacking protein [Armadillidium nasatum]